MSRVIAHDLLDDIWKALIKGLIRSQTFSSKNGDQIGDEALGEILLFVDKSSPRIVVIV
jgi:hypothetical protein